MTMTMANINNEALFNNEMMSEEQLDQVQGGIAPALIVAAVSGLVSQGISEAKDIKNLVTSAEYKAMSGDDRNKKLGKELANSPALNVAIGAAATPFAVIGVQIKWRKSGTSDTLREGIENLF